MNSPHPVLRRHFAPVLLLLVLIAAGLRLYRLPDLPLGLHYDEAANVILAGEIARGATTPVFIPAYTGKEVLFFYWAALWMRLLGATPFALRLSAALIGIATVAATAWAVRELFHGRPDADRIALLTAAFLAVSFWHLVFSRYGFRAVTQPLMQALTVAALWRGLRVSRPHPLPPPLSLQERGGGGGRGEAPWLLLSGAFCGLTAYTYLAARAFPIPLAAAWLALIVAERERRRARLGQLVLFAAVAALVLAPLAYYWWTHPGSFLNRTRQVTATDWAAAWTGLRACLAMFFLRGDPYIRFNLPGRSLFDPVTAALFVLGIVVLIANRTSPIGKSANRQIGHSANRQIGHSANRQIGNFPPCLPATRIFLLITLPAMLLPSALAVGDITPSNLRTIGLLPFVYVFPALGLSALQALISKLANRKSANRQSANRQSANRQISQSAGWVICHLSYVILFAALLLATTIAYFRHWASSAALYYAADGDLADVARYLNTTDLTDTTVYVASIHYRHPTLAALARDYDRIRWLTGGRTVVFPAQGEARLLVPRSAADDLAWIESTLPAGSFVAAPPGPEGAPAFRVYRIGATPGTSPTNPLGANLANAATLLGYDVVGEPRSGANAEVAVWWRVVNVPAQGDYGPVARLADPWGFAWGEVSPFHYPAEQWTPGETIVDHLIIPVAPGAPPGEYAVHFSLYSAQANATLNVLDPDGRYTGTGVELPLRLSRAAAPPNPDALDIRTRLDARADGLTLLGANLDTTRARPGEPLYLTLFWQANTAPLANYDIILTLGDATLYRGAPVHGTYPTSTWAAGEIVADRYDPRLPRDMPPGDYPLQVQVANRTVDLGSITVQPINRTFDVPPIAHPLGVTLGGQVELLGYDLSAEEVAPGGTLTLTLYWRALAEMDGNYAVFTHLVAADGSMSGQRDNPPVGGTYPTTLWVAGEVVADTYAIPIRADTVPGEHRLEVGMYIAETGARLAVAGSSTDAVVLQSVVVGE